MTAMKLVILEKSKNTLLHVVLEIQRKDFFSWNIEIMLFENLHWFKVYWLRLKFVQTIKGSNWICTTQGRAFEFFKRFVRSHYMKREMLSNAQQCSAMLSNAQQ